MKVEVYAILKDYFNSSFIVSEGLESVSELKQELIRQKPQAVSVLQVSRFAVNDEFVTEDYKLNEHDTIAILPPASGG